MMIGCILNEERGKFIRLIRLKNIDLSLETKRDQQKNR